MYAKATINVTVRYQLQLKLPGCEDLRIEITLANGKQCYFNVIYKHPITSTVDFRTHLPKSIEQLNKTKKKFYICEGMNIDFLKVQSYSIFKQHYDCIYGHGCLSLLQNPTTITASSSTLIDHIYTNDVLYSRTKQ